MKTTFGKYFGLAIEQFLIIFDDFVDILVSSFRILLDCLDQLLVFQGVFDKLLLVVLFLHCFYFIAAALENLLEIL